MDEILYVLVLKLLNKGLQRIEIQRLIKDVFNIIRDGGMITVIPVKQSLKQLGWEDYVMDEYVFELIIFYIECEFGEQCNNQIFFITD